LQLPGRGALDAPVESVPKGEPALVPERQACVIL